MRRAVCLISLFVLASLGGCGRHAPEELALKRSPEEERLFRRCKEVIAQDLHYTGELGGEAKAIQDRTFRSFMLRGPNKDYFSCEVYPDGQYKLLAAYGGKLPFKAVGKGKL